MERDYPKALGAPERSLNKRRLLGLVEPNMVLHRSLAQWRRTMPYSPRLCRKEPNMVQHGALVRGVEPCQAVGDCKGKTLKTLTDRRSLVNYSFEPS